MVLLAAGQAAWETALIRALADADLPVARRCVDVVDLLAVAQAHGPDAAVIAADLAGVDADAVRRLRAQGVRLVAVGGDGEAIERLTRLGIVTVRSPGDVVDALTEELARAGGPDADDGPADRDASSDAEGRVGPDPSAPGSVVAVWGPTGAPGRTTVATALAAEHAVALRRHRPDARVVLCDLDQYGGAVAASLGVLDEVSGLLSVARAANEGRLDAEVLGGCLRTVLPGLEVLSGLPRADRWREVRAGVVDTLLDLARMRGDVVLDCGFGIEDDERASLARDTMTLEALAGADRIVVVGGAEPVGLTRLARALDGVGELCPHTPLTVVVNRMRRGLAWREDDIVAMVAEIAPRADVCFWPDERALLDRALVAGVAPTELRENAVRAQARALAGRVFESAASAASSGAA